MAGNSETNWFQVNVPLAKNTRASKRFAAYAKCLQQATRKTDPIKKTMMLRSTVLDDVRTLPESHQAAFRACALLITDLSLQQWKLRISRENDVRVAPPPICRSRESSRALIRAQELIKRDAQLARPSVRDFILSMERKRLFNDQFMSIFDLMRDGQELAEKLRNSRVTNNGNSLSSVIKPYVQFVDAKTRCNYTGLRLMDIWRYFRHTWTNQYTSVPGRTMMMLVRDAAAPNHPVMGIASLSSPVIQISERDKWIGWHPATFLERIQTHPTAKLARWLASTVDQAVDEVYKADLLRDKLITRWRLEHPTEDTIRRLRAYALTQKKRHLRYARRSDFKKNGKEDQQRRSYWIRQARTPLFRSKRASSLADLLDIRTQLQHHFGSKFSASNLKSLSETNKGRRLIGKVVRKAKGDRVGVAMADITACGAIQPYNAILVGKLVSMLAVSPAVVAEYKRRYRNSVSQIASSMAGRPIVRKPELVYLGTTSLYGNGSSQYNRVKIPAEVLGGNRNDNLVYRDLGHSVSFGTSQFSDDTVEALVECMRQSTYGERVHSIFGEGVSPRLRKVREGLDLLRLPTRVLLQHGRRRSVYGVVLARNSRDYLIGIDRRAKYIFPVKNTRSVEAIAAWWCHRWLSSRIQSDDVLSQVAKHVHVHPMRHGARAQGDWVNSTDSYSGR